MISIMRQKNIWFVFSGSLIAISIIFLALWGLDFGIDFTGGSLMELSFTQTPPETSEITLLVKDAKVSESPSAQAIGERGIVLRFQNITEEEHQKLAESLKEKYKDSVTEERFDSIGPSIGEELKQKTVKALLLAIIGIIVYIAISFRKVSKPVSSWKYGVIAALTLFHDVIITLGLFSFLGKFYHLEVNSAFIAALLTIIGYSVNDTIVIFDRIRENLTKFYQGNLEGIIDKSLNETFVRSINTTLTVILTLLAILFWGGASIRDFALALTFGISIGSYSSIFLASPLLAVTEKVFKKKK